MKEEILQVYEKVRHGKNRHEAERNPRLSLTHQAQGVSRNIMYVKGENKRGKLKARAAAARRHR